MGWRDRYEKGKLRLLADSAICAENRRLFAEFFEYEEYKLKRKNGLARLDLPSYKTLYEYIRLFRNVNQWFENRPWKNLTSEDIKRVYDDLEDGRITNQQGTPVKDRASYYNKVLKSKPFRMVGKAEIARNVIEYYQGQLDKEVRFVPEPTFRRLVSVVSNPVHLLLFWLAWDLGENVGALVQLTAQDFTRQRNNQTKESEYLVHLPREKIKRSRRTRAELTLYPETVRYAEIVLGGLKPGERVFPFGYAQAWKLFRGAVQKTGVTCEPSGQPIRWKDLRSGMACHLLKSGWTREEVDARLGHTPNSSAMNAYLNYLAIDREGPKKRLFDSSLEKIQSELEESARREKLLAERLERNQSDNRLLRREMMLTKQVVQELQQRVEASLAQKTAN